jgi:hypothetical protein
MREFGDNHYIVDLNERDGIEEVIPLVYLVYKSILANATYPKQTLDILNAQLEPYIIDLNDGLSYQKLARVLEFILDSEKNPRKINPYSPEGSDLASEFESQFDNTGILMAKILWEHEERERIKLKLAEKSKSIVSIKIRGQVAAGKTTFLKTLEASLNAKAANIETQQVEPEDTEAVYQDLRSINAYKYPRDQTRGNTATFGQEWIQLFAFEEENSVISTVKIESKGGHIQADNHDNDDRSSIHAFFVDYPLMEKLSKLEQDTKLNDIFHNNERLRQIILSIVSQHLEWVQITGKKVLVLTKIIFGENIDERHFITIEKAYKNCLLYAGSNFDELEWTAQSSGKTFELPDSMTIDHSVEYLPIYNNYPTCTGTLVVLQRLISISSSKETSKIVTFDPNKLDENTIYYEDVL